ncbi:hypothetical protein WHI96_02770 [Pseudonocardia tropica]|uniref:Uncharacterized protein n=1 Tax=Pseudonocardia tropica TaxID=681289 RepID=A0ABV1JQH8_9PSEU
MTNEHDARTAQLLAAWENQYPTTTLYEPGDAAESAEEAAGRRLAQEALESTGAAQYGQPLTPSTLSLTRGLAARDRLRTLRHELHRAQTDFDGGDVSTLERDVLDATDQVVELERSGRADEVIELDRQGRSRTIYGPSVVSPFRPVH